MAGVLLTVLFRRHTGLPDATPSAADPVAFVASMRAIYWGCLAVMLLALVASLMRGGRKIEAAQPP